MEQRRGLYGIEITLADMDDWQVFVSHNRDAIIDEYGSIDEALKHACDGGLRLGGGALPIVDVTFEA